MFINKDGSFKVGKIIGLGALALAGSMVVVGGWAIVPPGHRGVSVTMGKVDPEFRREGVAFKMPVFTSIVPISIQQVRADGTAACFSSDLQTVHVSYAVLYRIPEARVVELYQQYKGDPYQSLVDSRVQEAMKQVTADYAAEKLVKSREEMRVKTIDKVRAEVGDLVSIIDINIANIDLSDQLEQAIENKMVQEQESLAMKFKLEKASKEAEITLVSAKAESESIRIKGDAIKESPQVIQLETVRKWNGVSPTTVVVGDSSEIILPIR